jgi:hypothetical protein
VFGEMLASRWRNAFSGRGGVMRSDVFDDGIVKRKERAKQPERSLLDWLQLCALGCSLLLSRF